MRHGHCEAKHTATRSLHKGLHGRTSAEDRGGEATVVAAGAGRRAGGGAWGVGGQPARVECRGLGRGRRGGGCVCEGSGPAPPSRSCCMPRVQQLCLDLKECSSIPGPTAGDLLDSDIEATVGQADLAMRSCAHDNVSKGQRAEQHVSMPRKAAQSCKHTVATRQKQKHERHAARVKPPPHPPLRLTVLTDARLAMPAAVHDWQHMQPHHRLPRDQVD